MAAGRRGSAAADSGGKGGRRGALRRPSRKATPKAPGGPPFSNGGWATRLGRGEQRGQGGTQRRPETPVEEGDAKGAGRSPLLKWRLGDAARPRRTAGARGDAEAP